MEFVDWFPSYLINRAQMTQIGSHVSEKQNTLCVKYLGVMIDNHLSWKHHNNYVALKISRNIGILFKLRHFVPLKTLYGICNSLISPYLSCGVVAWGKASKTHLDKLLILQKRAVRLINFAPFRSHAVPYFKKL